MDTIYIRTLKRAEHTVFCVQDGQKSYFDPQFRRRIPFSSGQQIKRTLLDSLNRQLNTPGSPTTFLWDVNKNNELKEGEVYGTCDPSYPDQLLGGWMKAAKGGKDRTLKRRSPLSISAMRGLHPLLAGVDSENISFDRSDRPNNNIIVRDEKGNELGNDEIVQLLEGKDRSLRRKWIPDNRRANGLFVQDMAIDLRRLFSVTLNPFEPEISEETEENLREQGWEDSENIFGPCLVAPQEERERLAPALAHAILNWQISSNQARTFSLMETLGVTISTNANKIANSIRARLSEEEENQAEPIIEEELKGVHTYVLPVASGYIRTQSEDPEALDKAEQKLVEMMNRGN